MSEHPSVAFRPLAVADLPMLAEWLARPHVAEWWDDAPTAAEIEEEFGPMIADPTMVQPYVILLDGVPSGYIQSYVAMGAGDGWWEDERDPGTRGIDQFLADPALLGRGVGTRVLRAFVDQLFDDPAVTRVQVDPAPENGRAIRCYEKARFRRVGLVETPDGPAVYMLRDRDAR